MGIFKKRFGKNNPNWDPNEAFTEMFIMTQLLTANEVLQNRGHVLLRDLYDSLGFETTKESCSYGWVKGVVKDDFVKCKLEKIDGTDDYELSFECYPILNYLPEEDAAE